VACDKKPEVKLMDKSRFQTTLDGKDINLYTIKSPSGLIVEVANFGGRIVSIWTPDKEGKYDDIVLGYDNINDYLNPKERFLGPVVGRYANRIAKGEFEIDGEKYNLPLNDNGQTLHGGNKGFDMVVWNVESVNDREIHLSYLSPDGEEGFPGNVKIDMIYSLTDDNGLKIEYKATTDKSTVINLSNHSIFNLKGFGNGTIADNILMIKATYITPVDSVLIPTGELMSVAQTSFDFNQPKAINANIEDNNIQLKFGKGYDHNWVLDRTTENEVELVASLYEPTSGRLMEVLTDQPGLQFYSGNFFNGKVSGKDAKLMNYREGLALETQKFPDSPNQPDFPTTRLNEGEIYTHTCIYKFGVK